MKELKMEEGKEKRKHSAKRKMNEEKIERMNS